MRIELAKEDVEPFLTGVKNRERGGILYGTAQPDRKFLSITGILEVPNRHKEPHLHFLFHAPDIKPRHNGYRIVGNMHTHILGMTGDPSEMDFSAFHMDKHYGMVLHVPTQRITFYDKDGIIASLRVKDLPSREDAQEAAG